MSGIRDTATVTLNVNGAQAKQMMSDLEAKIKATEATISSLKAKMADPKDIEKARKQLSSYQNQLDGMKSATEGVNKALGNLDAATRRQLEKALRAEKQRVYEATSQSIRYSCLCYIQQLEALEDEYRLHRENNPSKSQLCRMAASLCKIAEANGDGSITIAFGDNRKATVSFA